MSFNVIPDLLNADVVNSLKENSRKVLRKRMDFSTVYDDYVSPNMFSIIVFLLIFAILFIMYILKQRKKQKHYDKLKKQSKENKNIGIEQDVNNFIFEDGGAEVKPYEEMSQGYIFPPRL